MTEVVGKKKRRERIKREEEKEKWGSRKKRDGLVDTTSSSLRCHPATKLSTAANLLYRIIFSLILWF